MLVFDPDKNFTPKVIDMQMQFFKNLHHDSIHELWMEGNKYLEPINEWNKLSREAIENLVWMGGVVVLDIVCSQLAPAYRFERIGNKIMYEIGYVRTKSEVV